MAKSATVPLSAVTSDSTSRPENVDAVATKTAAAGENGFKEDGITLPALDDAAALPKGTIDPVYEAKARVLNHAVCIPNSPK
jgi:hypothetical protein